MRIVELILDEEQEESGIEAISIVESPAIESDFVALAAEEIKLAEVDKEKKILLGALLIPNKPIYRAGDEGEYYIFFSKDTVSKASQMYLKNGYQNNSTLEHDKEIWDEYILSGKCKGFSIEGYFADKMENRKSEDKKDLSEDEELLGKIKNILTNGAE